MTRREYVGNAPATTLNGAIGAATTTIVITDGTNWPTGASFPFVVIIDRGLAAEEKALITSRSGNTLTVNTRGFDSTTAASHANGATIEHGLSATDINEVNDHTFDTTNDDHTQYLNNARHDVEARHTFGAALGTAEAPADATASVAAAGSGVNPAREDHAHRGGVAIVTSATRPGSPYEGQLIYETDTDKLLVWNGASWVELVPAGAWTTYVPTNTNVTVGNGTQDAKFIRHGRMITVKYALIWGSTTAFPGTPRIGLPVTAVSAGAPGDGIGPVYILDSGTRNFVGVTSFNSTTDVTIFHSEAGNTGVVAANDPMVWTTADRLAFSLTYEAAS